MGPRQPAGELLQEQRRGDRARAAGGVVGVGDLRGELLLVVVDERDPPQRLAGGLAGRRAARGEGVVVGEEPPMCWPSATFIAPVRVATSTTTSGSSSATAYASASASTSRPSASVLVTSVVRPPYWRTHVAGAQRVAADGVLGGGDQPGDPDRAADGGEGAHHGDHDGAAGHVALHVDHRLGRLDRQAAGVEGDALADQHDVAVPSARPSRGCSRADQARRGGRGLADAEDAAEALGRELVVVPDRDVEAGLARRARRPGRPATAGS